MKFYAIVNRQGTRIRIKPQHRNLFNYLSETRAGKIPLEETNSVEFFSKKNFQIIRNELRIGFKESHIKVIDGKHERELIIGDESMKKEVLNAQRFKKEMAEFAKVGSREEEE